MIKVKDLTYVYEDETMALKNINMDFEKYMRIGVVGANGAGKSTLFQSLVGILKPTTGNILVDDKKIRYDKKTLYDLRRRVGILFQDPDKQIFYSNVYDDVAFGLRNLDIPESEVKIRVDKALIDAGAKEFEKKPVHNLSYGQKKRVAIAGILAMGYELICFDEPTAGLDPNMTEAVTDIIKELSNRGVRVVISSHNMDTIYELCEYIYVINKGEIIAEGESKEVFLKGNILEEAGLREPWLVKIHKNMNFPLFTKEEDLYKYWRDINGDSCNRG
ncbi:cobalt/nickel transport system ATP-binding protein [Clostridium collagenovorans DSM 3089]|uniref:ABC transporter ATP-binding protein n=1 Tax=Clostridium collagenovorans DSM 3089 TaxID=1121306 RepID=A0A1M5TVI2_9CLOT|nr:ATP-binding cassette domain-containing protein [Clostridium collagenovorans]SHH54671.1 cobalt/nickel transport system ATP-binding protein [Clostridium collagenovorans DSM 3089]